MTHPIYLDNNASTCIDPRVCEYIQTLLGTLGGNPSSTHLFGQKARTLVNQARGSIATFLSVKPQELVFTSCGTESVNMAIRGLLPLQQKGHIITSQAEHSCVYATVKYLEACGYEATWLSPGLLGAVTPEAVAAAIRPDTKLIALMAANNETGVKTDIEGIAKIAQGRGIPFFVDGVAIMGKESFRIPAGVTAMAFSGHKVHAPQGIGFCYLRGGVKFQALLLGGEQEHGRRGGTENVLGIAAVGKAIELLKKELPQASERIEQLRNKFENTLMQALEGVTINGEGARVGNVSNLAFAGVDGETLLMGLDSRGIAASHGAACSSGALEPSRVLLSMGLPVDMARSSLRFSLSRFTTEDEINIATQTIIELVRALRRKG